MAFPAISETISSGSSMSVSDPLWARLASILTGLAVIGTPGTTPIPSLPISFWRFNLSSYSLGRGLNGLYLMVSGLRAKKVNSSYQSASISRVLVTELLNLDTNVEAYSTGVPATFRVEVVGSLADSSSIPCNPSDSSLRMGSILSSASAGTVLAGLSPTAGIVTNPNSSLNESIVSGNPSSLVTSRR